MSLHQKSAASFWLCLLLLTPTATYAAAQANGQIEVAGHYRYVYHDPETPAEALTLACREAWRLAVIESPLYREHTASIVDSALLRDVAHNLVTRYLRDQQIVEQTEQGKTVSCRVRGALVGEDSVKAIRTQLSGGPSTPDALDQNRILRILAVREEGTGLLAIEYQALKRLDWLGTHYQGGLRESADIMVDFYDDQRFLIRTERYAANRTVSGDDVMNPGSTAVLRVTRPAAAKTYRVWLVK
jgi:hypothetical protein